MNKTALITGSAKGIGASVAKKLASKGYNVVINYKTSEEHAFRLKKEIESKYSSKVMTIQADITSESEIKNMIDTIVAEFSRIDILINNAALALDSNYKDKTKEEFMRVLEVNIVGTFLVTKYATLHMNDGIILNISSTDGFDTYNPISMDYCASKAGVNNLTKNFALALPNLKILAVMLPWVNTEAIQEMDPKYLESELQRIGQERLLEPSEVAKKILNIIEDDSIKSGSIVKVEI